MPVTANSIVRPRVAVALALDRSGSMLAGAGDGRTRVEVLREAAAVFLEVLQPANGVGLVCFDHDAQPVLAVVEAGPEVFGPGRAAAQAAVAAHVPNPREPRPSGTAWPPPRCCWTRPPPTSTTPRWCCSPTGRRTRQPGSRTCRDRSTTGCSPSGWGSRPTSTRRLSALVAGAGGWVGVSGSFSIDDRFLLARYFLQVLAGATNQQIVLS
ncbi:hypothetical protein G7085_13890 [Tessaracoccus sp. HDW20]|uniref:hypothetical protein n=1 Tax=Tessaracoccus coleopterorum TaxID=2714950 RepID=UPI0018D3C020|nr:hypothetical protein [Tessaracoccus coleopterorum]NHB85340.1 hypothetical protein [Tessaracoccus coleopterorum]